MATGIPSKSGKAPIAYELAYEGKMPSAQVLALDPIEPEAVPLSTASGRLYCGDNLGAMLWLMGDHQVAGKIRCVYIDPPFATAMRFVDRRERRAYEDTLAGAAYIEWLRRRLIVIRELMADDGSVFVHLDQNMVFEIKVIMDEVFGRDRFRNFITRRKCSAKNYTRKTFGNVADHILFYTRSDTYAWQRLYEPWSEKRVREEYPCLDEATGRRYKRVPLHAPGVRRGATGGSWRGMLPPPGKHWQYPPRRLDELDKAGEIYWSKNGNPRRKVFLDASKGVPVNDIWVDFKDPHNQNVHITGYPTEKNFDLLCRIISAASRPGDWVLDCFAGSGTTLEAAEALGRHFIGIDYEKAAIETIQKRLAAGRKPMGDYVKTRRAKNAASAHDLPLFHL